MRQELIHSDKPLNETGVLPSAERALSEPHETMEVVCEVFLVRTYGKGAPEQLRWEVECWEESLFWCGPDSLEPGF